MCRQRVTSLDNIRHRCVFSSRRCRCWHTTVEEIVMEWQTWESNGIYRLEVPHLRSEEQPSNAFAFVKNPRV